MFEITQEEAERIDKIITPLIANGHSIHHIHYNTNDSIMVCERTLFNYIDNQILSAKTLIYLGSLSTDLERRYK